MQKGRGRYILLSAMHHEIGRDSGREEERDYWRDNEGSMYEIKEADP